MISINIYVVIIVIINIFLITNVNAAGREGADSENNDERMIWAVVSMLYIFTIPYIGPENDIIWMWMFCVTVLGCWTRAGIAM